MEKLLQVKDLKTYFDSDDGVVKAVDGVDFSVNAGETIGIVGESGCGKSVTSMSILRLIPTPPGRIAGGEVLFNGIDLTKATDQQMRKIRGNDISMIFQEPMTSLNPVFTVGEQISEALILHQDMTEEQAMKRAEEMLKLVNIPRAEKIISEYPHQLSGGMRQRVMIAMALACQPKLLIADEPTTALDVTIQAQILDLMNDLKTRLNTAIMLITHDLAVVAEMSDHVIVMYAGKVVEDAPVVDLFERPMHPYTIGLMQSIPSLNLGKTRLETIEGSVPNPLYLPEGCYFNPRCKYRTEICVKEMPELREIEQGHKVRCHHAEEVRNARNQS